MKSYRFWYRFDMHSEICIGIIGIIADIYRYDIGLIYVYTYYWYRYWFDMNFKTDIGIDISLI